MNDFLKNLLKGLPQNADQQNDPYLDPSVYPSPMMSPMQALEQEVKTKQNVPLRPMTFEPEKIQAELLKPATIKPGLPPTGNAEAMDKIELPQEVQAKKAPTLEDILAGVKPDNELANAQSANQDFIRNVLLARAGNKIGSSIAGVKADDQFGQDLIDYSGKKVSDLQTRKKADVDARNQAISEAKSGLDYKRVAFELGDKEKENDPNSEVSKAFREYAQSYVDSAGSNIKIPKNLSMADLQKQMGVIGQQVQMKMTQDARQDAFKLKAMDRETAKKDKQNTKNQDFMERQFKNMKASKNYKAAEASESLVSLINDTIKNPSAIKEIAATYETIKTLDSESAVREGEVGLLQSGLSYRAKLQSLASKATTNPTLYGPDFMKTLKDYADFKKDLTKKLYDKEFSAVKALGKNRGISDEDIELMNPMSGYYQPEENKKPSSGKVTVTNGKDTFEIDEADLAEAKQDGFEKVK